jgi:hypothetical protein
VNFVAKMFKRDKKTRKLVPTKKERHIFYSSHMDGYIYGFYGENLLKNYNSLLQSSGLDDNVLAYRRIEKSGQKYSNIEMATEAFEYIKNTNGCNVICLDIKSFFDNLCPTKLKEKWCQVIGATSLPEDHYNIYRSLTNFRFVNEEDCISIFNVNPRKQNLKGGSRANQICSLKTFEANHKQLKKDQGTRLAKKKSDLIIEGVPFKGIPQGSAMSGLLSNIFMYDFDIEITNYMRKIGGFYRRYSDDILIAFPQPMQFSAVEKEIFDILNKTSNNKLTFSREKTERRIYKQGDNKKLICLNYETGNISRLQYLGFTFDGEKIHVRNSSISKHRFKIAATVRKNKKGNKKINTRLVYKSHSPRKITQEDRIHRKGFVFYATRASKSTQSEAILRQLKKNDRYIKNKIKEERVKARKLLIDK